VIPDLTTAWPGSYSLVDVYPSSESLREYFEAFGPIETVTIMCDPEAPHALVPPSFKTLAELSLSFSGSIAWLWLR